MKDVLLLLAGLIAIAAGLTPHHVWKELWEMWKER